MSKLPVSSYPSSKWTIQCSINKFSFKLFKNLSTKLNVEMSNLCFSPLEVFNSLVMLLLGANGVSEKELEEVLCLKDFNNLEKYEELMDLCEWIIKSRFFIVRCLVIAISKLLLFVTRQPRYNAIRDMCLH